MYYYFFIIIIGIEIKNALNKKDRLQPFLCLVYSLVQLARMSININFDRSILHIEVGYVRSLNWSDDRYQCIHSDVVGLKIN